MEEWRGKKEKAAMSPAGRAVNSLIRIRWIRPILQALRRFLH
jgi:hypothetical protein